MAPKGKQKKREAAQSITRQRVDHLRLSTEHEAYAEMLVNPGDTELTRQPALIPRRATVVRDKQIVDLSGATNFFIEVKPNPSGTLQVTNDAAAAENGETWVGHASGEGTVYMANNIIRQDGTLATPSHTQSAGTQPQYYFVSTAGGNVDFKWSSAATHKAYTYIRVSVNGAAAASGSVVPPGGSSTLTVACPAATDRIWIEVVCDSVQYTEWEGPIEITPQATILLGLATSSSMAVYSVSLLDDVKNLRWYRVTGQAVLVTWTGSDLNNGGVIAAARVAGTWAPQTDSVSDYYDVISDLPFDSYDGALKHGAHVHWMPESLNDFEPHYLGRPPIAPLRKLVVAGRFDDSTQSCRVRVITIIEYFTDSPSYGAMVFGPPWADFDAYLAILDGTVPAATSNDSHIRTKVKKGLRDLRRWVMTKAKEEATDPANYAKLAALFV